MESSAWTDAHTKQALQYWEDYQKHHDVSHLKGRAVGIDPTSGRVWFGDSIVDISHQLDAEGIRMPLYFTRVGSAYYQHKGGRRR